MENTIVAIATATGESGIGIVRLSGEKSIDIVKNFLSLMIKRNR
ncbi:GTP-binding protein TrmE N-terminus domain protein [Parvimonas sp. oral taxon 393 str. F0440]|nr:GTP-binding protein TrmE N-terminus domain protein [Parvimonas sp. oral taxon 393 str. F0440]